MSLRGFLTYGLNMLGNVDKFVGVFLGNNSYYILG